MNNFDLFVNTYKEELEVAVKEYPEEYAFPVERVPEIVRRMSEAFKKNSYNKDSRAIKVTCKKLKIKHTYKDINSFIAS